MAFVLPELVQETTTATNGASPVATYTLAGAVTQRKALAAIGNGNQTLCLVTDKASPPTFHTFLGTYNSGPNTVTVNSTLTGTGIWGGGTRNIWITPVNQALATLIGAILPGGTPGVLVNDASWSVSKRSILFNAAAGLANDFITLINGTGAAGNITHTQQGDPLFRNPGASDLQAEMKRPLRIAAASGQLKFTQSPIEIAGPLGLVLRIIENAANDATAQLRVGGSWIDVFTSSSFTYPKVVAGHSTQTAQAAIQADTTIVVAVPSTGTWWLIVYALGHGNVNTSLSSTSTVTAAIDEKISSASVFTNVKQSAPNIFSAQAATSAHVAAPVLYTVSPAAGATHTYQLTMTAGSNADLALVGTETHSLVAVLLRTA